MKTRARKRLTPRTASTFNQLCALPRDNVDTTHFWIIVDTSHVTIAEQDAGAPVTARMQIPKRVFNKFVDFYNGVPQKRKVTA